VWIRSGLGPCACVPCGAGWSILHALSERIATFDFFHAGAVAHPWLLSTRCRGFVGPIAVGGSSRHERRIAFQACCRHRAITHLVPSDGLKGLAISSLVLRDAGPEDVDLILALIRELAVFERLEPECVADTTLLRHYLFEDVKAKALVAEWEGASAGFALYFYNFSTFVGRPGLYLEDLFVRPAFRRRGIARAIFHWLARKAVAEGCGRFEWSVLDWNETAIAFYRGLGARPMEEWIIQRLSGEALQRLAAQP
jgi:GNAT superfamily N-acetyltransferase